jgi:hydrogenase maturation protease
VIGVGNPWRGDDAAGLAVARLVRERADPRLHVVEHEGEATALLDLWAGADDVVVVDAASSGAPPGAVHRIDPVSEPIPAGLFSVSSHVLGVADAVELARAVGRLPARLTVYGIEGADFSLGARMAPQVVLAAREVADEIGAGP